MVSYSLKRFCWVFGFLLIAIYIPVSIIRGHWGTFDALGMWNDLSTRISIVVILAICFEKWFWKLKILQGWLVPFPCIEGDWEGTLHYRWNDNDFQKKVKFEIRQTFLCVQVIIQTDESRSNSICASFDIDKMRGQQHLVYTYLNEPDAVVRERSQIHYGTARLLIDNSAKLMNGNYWTDRKSIGTIRLLKKT